MPEAGIRLLYVDDDTTLVRLIERTLGRRGFTIVHAPDADTAMTRIGEGGFDVIALDHNLPTGTGLDLLGRLSAVETVPAVVYVTGSADMDVAVAALKAGADDFVPKTPGEDFLVLLRSALEQAVEKTRLRAAHDAAEREVRLARDRAEMLLREVNHRVANSLSLVSSLVSLQANAVADQGAKDALAETQARIYAVSLVHKRLYTSGDVRFVEIADYLRGLLEHLESSLRTESAGVSLDVQLEPLNVPTDLAVNVGVVLTELVTNAYKYAYPAGRSGEIRVRFAPLSSSEAELEVSDDGAGWTGAGNIQGTGLGTRIIRAMAMGISANLTYDPRPSGTTARFRFPIPAAE